MHIYTIYCIQILIQILIYNYFNNKHLQRF